MGYNKAEDTIAQINTNVFFKEFTFCKNDFKALDSNQKLEFADNVVWLDDLLFIFQIKERNKESSSDDRNWYNNKVINKGVKQIKSTLKYLTSYPDIKIENEKGHVLNISEASNCNPIRKIIIYSPNDSFPEELRQKRFYESSEVGLIHLFHAEDYYWICRYLITPAEIDEYLGFREDYYLASPKRSDIIPEQYILAHFFETTETDHYDPEYISNLQQVSLDFEQFDLSHIIKNFADKITFGNYRTEYYPIIQEIAKLNRAELNEFKKRFIKSAEVCESKEIVFPYRFFTPRTDCAFIFVPIHSSKSCNWNNILHNFAGCHKYDQKARKCLGVAIFRDPNASDHFIINWSYLEKQWEFDSELEQMIKDNPPPFRDTEVTIINNRYKRNN